MTRFRSILLAGWICGMGVAVAMEQDESDFEESSGDTDILPPLRVTAPVYKMQLSRTEAKRLFMFFKLQPGLFGFLIDGDFVLTPERLPQASNNVIYPVVVLDGDGSRKLRSASWDAAMTSRFLGDSWITAGGKMPARIARSGREGPLVLVEGIPQNDLWDGIVRWNTLPREGLLRAEAVFGGGAVVWDEAARGVVQLIAIAPAGKLVTEDVPADEQDQEYPMAPKQMVVSTGRFVASVGELGTHRAEFLAAYPTSSGVLQLTGGTSSTHGFSMVLPPQRGPVDTRCATEAHWLGARWRQPFGDRLEIVATIRGDDESGNFGTAYREGGSSGMFGSVALAGRTEGDFSWSSLLYAQTRRAHRTWSLVDAMREAETPAVDEFAIPTTGWGASWMGVWRPEGNTRTNFGLDLRLIRGETQSYRQWKDDAFAQLRTAGGARRVASLFLMHHRQLSSSMQTSIGGRIGRSNEHDGFERESERASGVLLKDERYARKEGNEFSPTAGLVWAPQKRWRVRMSSERGFRRPTLSQRYGELHEYSRVIEPNRELKRERRTTSQVSINYGGSASKLTVTGRAFSVELRDAIGSLRDRAKEEFSDRFERRSWINIDRARLQGLDLTMHWRPTRRIEVEASGMITHSEIQRAAQGAELAGHGMVGVPHRAGGLSASYQMTSRLNLRGRVQFLGREFVDEENTRRVGEAVLAEFGASYSVRKATELFFVWENIGNVRTEMDKAADGIVYTGAPRTLSGGLRFAW